MNILYLAHIRFPTERAHGAQVAHMCNAFAHTGHNVELVVPKTINPIWEDAFSYYDLEKNFSITYLYCTPWYISSRLKYMSSLAIFLIRVHILLIFSRAPLLYSRDEFILWYLSFFVSARRLLWESHESKYNFAARGLFRRGVKCIAISEGIRDAYTNKGIQKEQILVAHDGIDGSFFGSLETKQEARVRLGIDSEKPIVMYIGGLDAWKGVGTLFEASKLVEAASFVVIGGRDVEVEVYSQQYPGIQFLGSRPYRELAHNQQAADILVVPNTAKNPLSAQYTSPLKLFAHLASGVPLVVSDIPSLRNVVGDRDVAFFTPDSPLSLAKTIGCLLEDMGTASRKAKRAQQNAHTYTWLSRARRILIFRRSVSA